MRPIIALAVLSLAACSETGLNDDLLPPVSGEANPVDTARVTDTHYQNIPKTADILFVISNWWSSEQLQQELINAFDEMLRTMIDSGVDYHVGVISTDTDHFDDNGKLREGFGLRWIDVDTPSPMLTFQQMATMHAEGCVGPRRPRDATYMALEVEKNNWNLGFRRTNASLHTVFVSDDADQSYIHSFEEWTEWYGTHTHTPELDSLSTIVDLAADTVNPTAASQFQGTVHEIENLPWDNALDRIALRVRGPRMMFNLSRMPEVDSIEVWVADGEEERLFEFGEDETSGEYMYLEEENAILFHDYRPPSHARVDITYVPK